MDCILESAAVCGVDEYTDEAAAADIKGKVSRLEYGGDWEIFCSEQSLQPDGQIYAAMYGISPIVFRAEQISSLGCPGLYMDPCSSFNIMTSETHWEPPWPWRCYTMIGKGFPTMNRVELSLGSSIVVPDHLYSMGPTLA